MSQHKLHKRREEIASAIARLSHFSPKTTDDYGYQLLDYLVLDFALDHGTNIVSVRDIKFEIKGKMLVDFEEDEIVNAASRLERNKLLKVIPPQHRFGRAKIQVLAGAQDKVETNRRSISELESDVIQEWRKEITSRYDHKAVTENIYQLVGWLKRFTAKMFVRHGIDTVALLYPGESKIKTWLRTESKELMDGIINSGDSFLDNVAKIEIPRFFQSENAIRNHYISNLFNASFFWHIMQVDESCSRLLRDITRGQKLMLDNNILYSIVGLHGKDSLNSVMTMLKFAQELGYELYVTNKTLDEFQNTLRWHLKEAKEELPLSADLAKIALEELGEKSFLTSYWKQLVETGVTIEEFVANITYIEDILANLNITVFTKFRKDIEKSQELLDEMSTLRQACGEHINEHIVEHDAYHRILITKLRKGPKYNFNEAKAWFLTHDHKLPQYSKLARKGKDELPFCITANEWIQINRPLLTRTHSQEEFEESFHVLVTQYYVRSMLPTVPLERAYNKVLSKLERFKGMTPELASKIASDNHFMLSIVDIDSDQAIDKKIENRLIDLNRELRRQNEALKVDNKNVSKEQEKLIVKLEKITKNLEDREQAIKEQGERHLQAREIDAEEMGRLQQEVEDKKNEVESLKGAITNKAIKEQVRNWRLPGYFALAGALLILVFMILIFIYQDASWNIASQFIDWIEGQDDTRKGILQWGLAGLLGLSEVLISRFVWKRLASKDARKDFLQTITKQ